ncbi:hypothetical protein [Papillibacter cinnamivorans]|uniref:Uncharacterized protein n=1 Tax=Papillibacter cinnamivorans DSM 12816 TaxID=1122930 RepID=A0A1W1YVI3_9FIRM|nr:hypothetical protein [Papillibacter cinnamivorans]SMC40207.1 hypothetical protein SAMN02745168_0704 [Papillibacter cinnamivorans DSM 12816]
MKERTKTLSFAAVLAALSLVVLFLSAVAPTGRLALVAVAGLLPAAAVIRFGIPGGLFCYAVTGILSLLLLPDKGTAVLYLLFFGHYPVVKSLIERLGKLPLEWFLKLCVFNALLFVLYFGFFTLFAETVPAVADFALFAFLLGNAAFIVYDLGFSRLIFSFRGRLAGLWGKGTRPPGV